MPIPEPIKVNTMRVIEIGMALWVVALVAVIAVPSLREDDRSWWVWVPVVALALGALGWAYIRRGRGNAADAPVD